MSSQSFSLSSRLIRPVLLAATLCLGLNMSLMNAAHAEDTAYPALQAACEQNPEKCAELRAKAEAKCAENPQACAERKAKLEARAEKLQEKCANDPEKCTEMKTRMQKRLADAKAKCAANPSTCEQKKAAARERFQQRQQTP